MTWCRHTGSGAPVNAYQAPDTFSVDPLALTLQPRRNLAWSNSELMKISVSREEVQEYFLKARDGYTAGLSTWLRITPLQRYGTKVDDVAP